MSGKGFKILACYRFMGFVLFYFITFCCIFNWNLFSLIISFIYFGLQTIPWKVTIIHTFLFSSSVRVNPFLTYGLFHSS